MLLRLFKCWSAVLDYWIEVVFEHCVFVQRYLRVFFRIVLLLTWCVAVLWNIVRRGTVSVWLLCSAQWVLLRFEQADFSGCFMLVVVCDLSVQLLLVVLPANFVVLRFQWWQLFAARALALLCWIARTFLLVDFIFVAVKQNRIFMNHHSLLWNQSTFFILFFLSIILCWQLFPLIIFLTIITHLAMTLVHPLPVDLRLPFELSHHLLVKALLVHLWPHQLVNVVPALNVLFSQLGKAASRRWTWGWPVRFVDQVDYCFFLQVLFLDYCGGVGMLLLLRLRMILRLAGNFAVRHEFHIAITCHQLEVKIMLMLLVSLLLGCSLLSLIASGLLIQQILIMLEIQLPRPLGFGRLNKLIHFLTLVLGPTATFV